MQGLEATTAIVRAIGAETDVDRVLELIVKRGRALIGARSLVLLLAEGTELVVAASAGQVESRAVGSRIPIEGTAAGQVLSRRAADAHERRPDDAQARGRGPRRGGGGDRHARAARLSPERARHARGVRQHDRRRRVRRGAGIAARDLRGQRGDRGRDGQDRRARAAARLAGGGGERASPLGARAARRHAAGPRRPAGPAGLRRPGGRSRERRPARSRSSPRGSRSRSKGSAR